MTDLPRGTRDWQDAERVRRFLSGTRAAIPLAAEQLQVMQFLVAQAFPSGEVQRVLDVGSGSGVLSRLLLDQYPQAHAILVDSSEPMLEVARQQFTPEQAVILQANLNDPAWLEPVQPHAPLDVVVSGYAIHHLSDARKQALYAEVFSLLRPGGIFINIEHVASPSPWVEELFIEAFADNLYAAAQARGDSYTRAEIVQRLHEPDGDIVASVEAQCGWLRQIGFLHVDCYMKIYAAAVFGGIHP
jgi:ubiquinone/menaquinone biosynthesis C-methylase UbiE